MVQRVVDELKIYRGDDIRITDDIIIHNPTLNDIVEIGEKKFLSFCHRFPIFSNIFLSDYIIVLIFSTIIADYQEKCRQFNDSYRYFSIF